MKHLETREKIIILLFDETLGLLVCQKGSGALSEVGDQVHFLNAVTKVFSFCSTVRTNNAKKLIIIRTGSKFSHTVAS